MLTADHTRVTIGRRDQSDVPLTWDGEVSRAHALLEPVGGEWTLIDDGLALNGSFVNGSRIHGRHRLEDKDHMYFGQTRVVYREPGSEPGSQSTARALDSPASIPLTETQRKLLIALCRPIVESNSATPATNPQIAAEVHLSVDARQGVTCGTCSTGSSSATCRRTRSANSLVAIVLGSGLLCPARLLVVSHAEIISACAR